MLLSVDGVYVGVCVDMYMCVCIEGKGVRTNFTSKYKQKRERG